KHPPEGAFLIHKIFGSSHTIFEVREMDKKDREKLNGKKNNEEFNSITEKVKPENQNQHHNARKEVVDVKMRQM
ncbi:MAG TPA: hypothetical protein DEB74_12545, partial [Lachnospiraceae bacterium]|nr:hypothetical protein [Lachnospiraceae bacterium]